jgi:phosphatidylethanolamine-binding protein (PEBP) family uncharacterized protein
LYALNDVLDLKEGSSKEEIYKKMAGKIIAKDVLVGLYEQEDNKKSIEIK